jgi:hypothetical protein
MAWVMGGKHFGQYTYEHWFDDEYDEKKPQDGAAACNAPAECDSTVADSGNLTPGKPQQQP